jgi:hypothetical protein
MPTTKTPQARQPRRVVLVRLSPIPLIIAIIGVLLSALFLVVSTLTPNIVLDLLGYLATFVVVIMTAVQRRSNLQRSEEGRLDQQQAARRQKILMGLAAVAVLLAVVHGWRIATWVGVQWLV